MTKQRWIECAVIAALGLLTIWIYQPRLREHTLSIKGFESLALAHSLAEHRGFSDPFDPLRTGPSAHLAPLYPAYLAGLMILFGESTTAGNIAVWLSVLMLALLMMMLPLLAKRLGLSFLAGVLAVLAWFAAGIPPIYVGESTFAALLVVFATYLMMVEPSGEISRKHVLASGVIWGLMLLTQPVVILVLPVWIAWVHFRSKTSRLRKIALAALPLLIVAPWVARDFLVFHRPVFIRDNLGLELSVSNNDCATALFEINERNLCFDSTHPNVSYPEAVKVRELGEVEYNRLKLRRALGWIKSNPRRFATLCAERFEAFWFPPSAANNNNGTIWRPMMLHVFTLLSLPGLLLMWRGARPAAYILLMWLALFPLIYYVIQFMDRYRYPIFWVTFLAGSYCLVEFTRGIVYSNQSQGKPELQESESVTSKQ
jgi:hypothetical protein